MQRIYHPKQRCGHMVVTTLLAVFWKFLSLHKRRNRNREAASEEMLPLQSVWTECGKLRGDRAVCTWPRMCKHPSPVACLPLNLEIRTSVGKQDCFRDTRWQFQFSFVTENVWSPWILSSHLDQGTRSPVLNSLAPVMRQRWQTLQSLVIWVCSGKKVPLATHQICWRAQKADMEKQWPWLLSWLFTDVGFPIPQVKLLLFHNALHLPEWGWCHLFLFCIFL